MEEQLAFRLLLVDDEASVVDSLADTLPWEQIGIGAVFKAYSGVEALEILNTNTIDILITDIRMPGISGLELLQQVRRSWKRIKCILLSGHAEFAYAQQAIAHETYDYLLKPISDDHILEKVSGAVQALKKELDEKSFHQRVARAFQENLPKLQGELLNELLEGRNYSAERLPEKLESLKIPVAIRQRFALMLVRLEGKLSEMDFYSLSLMEYAVSNMAEELFEERFRLWTCKTIHGYLVGIVTEMPENAGGPSIVEKQGEGEEPLFGLLDDGKALDEELQLKASQLQLSVNHYLSGEVSVIVSQWGLFPHDVRQRYEDVLLALRRQVGSQSGLFIHVACDIARQQPVHSLQRLYEPPMLIHLMESGSWEMAEQKLFGIWSELSQGWPDSPEHLMEVFFSIYASFSSFAHKNGRELAEMIGPGLSDMSGLLPSRSITALKSWIDEAFRLLRQSMENDTRNDREITVGKIRSYIEKNLVTDVTLQAIADYLFMHPVHVSRIFKLATGENVSDYVLRLKMELAASMLANPALKSYEVALQLGYQNPNYFNKVFKKYYSLTPQEYRQRLEGGKELK
ncbi:DNA-binding response regulator [Paenibacillus sp. BIHB 4019]|uniref:DNA-binding response regulator n=1 Tax=Paenibacillus sp. BIHB 4019 TaxID=1870819 RepID=A0A1B2DIA9_9BACL|nr:response regulator [Paenibacillus sp. BIHB 4019]ANY67426.1 DNA-binding response regulator [Paenibacillus sp. BIHB 4019]